MNTCPRCLGVFPGDGPDEAVCQCGSAWVTGALLEGAASGGGRRVTRGVMREAS